MAKKTIEFLFSNSRKCRSREANRCLTTPSLTETGIRGLNAKDTTKKFEENYDVILKNWKFTFFRKGMVIWSRNDNFSN